MNIVSGQHPYAGAFTYASLPSAASVGNGALAFVTDAGADGIYMRSNGTRWKAFQGAALLQGVGAPVTGITNVVSATNRVLRTLLPVNIWQGNDIIRTWVELSKGGANDNASITIYGGPTGDNTDTVLVPTTTIGATANRAGGNIVDLKMLVDGTVLRCGGGGSAMSFGWGTGTEPAAVALPNAFTAQQYISVYLASGGGTDQVKCQAGQFQLVQP